jgi:RNA polymerase sigma-70 factor (ECF subfamily)
MVKRDKYIELVKQAQLGDKDALNRLAEVARERLSVHVYRLVLAEAATQDIVQECMIQMFKMLDKLKRTDRFWSWLYGIAHNKILHYRRTEWRQKKMSMTDGRYPDIQKDEQEGLESLISRELKQIVSAAMAKLNIQQREVLAMRCYNEMTYSEIAESMGCSEVGAQMRFFRAKKALRKQLSRRGLGKGSLLMALALFGKMTAPSKATAAQITVTAATTKVGVAASVAAIAASKTAILSLTTAGALTVGTMVVTSGPETGVVPSVEKPTESSYVMPQEVQVSKSSQESWYYYPSNSETIMFRRIKGNSNDKNSYCQWLQNHEVNYYFDNHKNTIYINNYRMWRSDLGVSYLPTDAAELSNSLVSIGNEDNWPEYNWRNIKNLLVIVKQNKGESSNNFQITHHKSALGEDYFQSDWPGNAKVVDNRDSMHKRGWTFFKITGQINGKNIKGKGRMPFVGATSERYWPWVMLKVGNNVVNEANFVGLGRPWMGLHTIDTVRRDAIKKQMQFRTKLLPSGEKAEVVLTYEQIDLVYTIDMKKDVIDKITFSAGNSSVGELTFTYLQEIDHVGNEFAEPRRQASMRERSEGMLWLLRLVESKLGQKQ